MTDLNNIYERLAVRTMQISHIKSAKMYFFLIGLLELLALRYGDDFPFFVEGFYCEVIFELDNLFGFTGSEGLLGQFSFEIIIDVLEIFKFLFFRHEK